jgi:hypothetical protein
VHRLENKWKYGILLLLIAVVGISVYSAGALSPQAGVGDGITHYGIFHIVQTRNGVVIADIWTHNFITNRGKDLIKMALTANSTPITLSYLALGNVTSGNQLVTDTDLYNIYTVCGLSVGAGTQASQAPNGNWSVAKTFTYTGTGCTSNVVNLTGIYNITTAGNLFAEANFTSVTLNSGDQITITYNTWVS